MKTALVTLVIGDAYEQLYQRYVRARFEHYAARHGYDLKVITQPVRNLPGKKMTWQKLCLMDMPWFRDYEQLAFVDADILIAKDAPPLPVIPPGKVGGVHDKLPYQMNSGVLVYHPGPEIAAVFEESLLDTDPFWDQKALTRSLLYRRMEEPIDPRFNRQFYFKCWTLPGSLFHRQWFYHACHGKSKLPFLHAWLKLQMR